MEYSSGEGLRPSVVDICRHRSRQEGCMNSPGQDLNKGNE